MPHCVTGNCNELRRKERPRKVKRVKCDSIHSFILSFFGSLILPPFSSCGSCENPISHIRLSGCGPERTQGCRSGHTQDAQIESGSGPVDRHGCDMSRLWLVLSPASCAQSILNVCVQRFIEITRCLDNIMDRLDCARQIVDKLFAIF